MAVVSAGVFDTGEGPQMQALQPPPALASRHGHVEVVAGATHNGLLGKTYAPAIVRGIEFVLQAAKEAPIAPDRMMAKARAGKLTFASR